MAKRGLFEKLGLVERIEDDIPMPEDVEDYIEEEIDVETNNVTQENFVSDVYESNNLSDLSESIFKVEEISNNLPNTMTKETKQGAIVGILASFNLTSEAVRADAEKRILVLNTALRQVINESEKFISERQEEIEEAKRLIENCQKVIADCEHMINVSTNKVEAEIKRINGLVEFITLKGEQK